MRIFVLEDDFSQQARIETVIEKLLKEHHITRVLLKFWQARPTASRGA